MNLARLVNSNSYRGIEEERELSRSVEIITHRTLNDAAHILAKMRREELQKSLNHCGGFVKDKPERTNHSDLVQRWAVRRFDLS